MQVGVGVDVGRQFAGDARRLEEIIHLEANAGHPVIHLVEPLGVLHVDEGQAAVVFEHADLENADHLESFQARHDAGWRHCALRRDQGHLVAGKDAQRTRQVGTENDTELAGLEVVETPAFH